MRRATALALIVGALILFAVLDIGSQDVRAAHLDIALYATTVGGWGITPGSETNPGPTLIANLGDDVHMTLTNEDPPPVGHAFWIDYDNDGVVDLTTEPNSPEFTTTSLFAFTANTPGTFTYYCTIHSGPPFSPTGSIMRGTWITRGPPVVAIASPVASNSWSGSVPHDITFNLVAQDPPGNLTVWVNYSASGGLVSGTIAGPIPGTTNPNTVSWTPGTFDATDVVVNVTAADPAGRRGYGTSAPFEVDSTAPIVTATAPSSGATGTAPNAQVRVTWSEGMNRSATESSASFGLVRVSDGTWIAGSTAWSGDSTQMAFRPSTFLDPFTEYEGRVNATGRDDSEPGNVAVPMTWRFTTGDKVDTTSPVVASVAARPPVQAQDEPVNLTADVTDDRAVGSVSVRVIGPSFDANLTTARSTGATWFTNRTYATKGDYAFTVWATDDSGNLASRGGSFAVRDVTPPAAPAAVSASLRTDGTVAITWSAVAGPDVSGYHVYRSVAVGGPYSLISPHVPASGLLEFIDRNAESGVTYRYVVTALDVDGNESPFSSEAVVTASGQGSDLWLWAAVAAIAGSALLAGVFWLLHRRRRGPIR